MVRQQEIRRCISQEDTNYFDTSVVNQEIFDKLRRPSEILSLGWVDIEKYDVNFSPKFFLQPEEIS